MQLVYCVKLKLFFIIIKLLLLTQSERCLTLTESQLESVLKRILNESFKVETSNSKADDLQFEKEQIKEIPSGKWAQLCIKTITFIVWILETFSEPGSPLNISMTFYIEDINSISDVNMVSLKKN